MEKYIFIVLSVTLSYTVAPPPGTTKHYRTDYEYNGRTDAFYKLHIEPVRFYQVRNLCTAEGAELMVPTSDQDIAQLHLMFKRFPDIGEYAWVGDDGQKHDSAEEHPIIDLNPTNSGEIDRDVVSGRCDVVTRKGDIETELCYRELPFICKVAARDAPYDRHCGVYGNDYKYYSSAGSCYKIPRIPYTWSQAYSDCQAEGAHLVVVNSEAEHQAIMNLTNTEPLVLGTRAFYFFFAGYRADKPVGNETVVFKTIFNQTLDEAGYSEWSANEPNNALGREYCGSIFKNDGKLNDLDCSHDYGFICEKEVSSSF